ncbi:hypothetical protein [Luteibacter sp.]|uniref:hypothetical protein n=1 Tax=Luteibacter sp. TaxID=1886636 RepID=UPI003F7E5D2F
MTRILPCLALMLATLASTACATSPTHAEADRQTAAPFNLVNATAASVATLALAPSGTDAFQPVDLGGALNGGLTSTAFQLPNGPCLRDMQVTFSDERISRLNGIDVCRTHGLRLDSLKGRMISPDSTLATQGPVTERVVN